MSEAPKIALLQLGRKGDCVNALGIAYQLALDGNEVHWYVSKEHAVILESCSYVIVHPLDLRDSAVPEAIRIVQKEAKDFGFVRIVTPQVNGNESGVPCVECENFTLKQYALAGIEFLTNYHKYRPLFDRRNRKEEESVIAKLPKEDGRPLLLVNFKSTSSPYMHNVSQWEWIFKTFSKSHRIYDLSDKVFAKPQYILPLLEKAEVLITVDTLTLHLAYATMTPTIQMSPGTNPRGRPDTSYDSEPRKQVVFKCSYMDSVSPVVRAKIETIIREKDYSPNRLVRGLFSNEHISPHLVRGGRRIFHVTNWYLGNKGDNPRILRARATWEELRLDPNYYILDHQLTHKDRSSRDIGDTRKLPYIRDIIDFGCSDPGATENDIVVFSNSDVAVVPEMLMSLRQKMQSCECCYSRRIDVLNFDTRHTLQSLKGSKAHVGADLFAFSIGFWRKHRETLPDLYLGCEGWDFVARHWCQSHNPKAETEVALIYHQIHPSYWQKSEIIHDNPAQVHNRKACELWAKENGCEMGLQGNRSKYLFKSDSEFVKKSLVAV